MNTSRLWGMALVWLLVSGLVFPNTPPSVTNVTASQRTDGSGIVDIAYTLTDADNDKCNISIVVSNDGGNTWTITPSSGALSGTLTNVSPGRRTITWASKTDLPGEFGTNYRIKVVADDGPPVPNITWVSISNSGFSGQMSRYETTNAQFAQYLNAALASGYIFVIDYDVYGAGGKAYRLNGPGGGETVDGATNVEPRIGYSGGTFTVDSGFGNHPVTYVSWYGATAFAYYYGWRLPTEMEWQAVASFNGAYTYGCGNAISNSIANYAGSYHPHGTTPVGQFGTYGYGMADMAGNVWEWTSTTYIGSRVIRGGCWSWDANACALSFHFSANLQARLNIIGFRVCR